MHAWHSRSGFQRGLKPCQREMETCVNCCKCPKNSTILTLENWKRARAPFCPYFFRSTILESRVKNPAFFNEDFKDSSALTSARASPCEIAPACPVFPPPFYVDVDGIFADLLNVLNGALCCLPVVLRVQSTLESVFC